jgi:flagellar basal body-associated protein FliL
MEEKNKKTAESEKKEKKNTGLIITLILIIILLLGALGGAGYFYNTTKEQEGKIATQDQSIKTKNDTIAYQIGEIKRYQDELQAKSDSLMALGESNEALEKKIQYIQKRLNSANRDATKLKDLQAEIEKYKAMLAAKDREIDSLKTMESGYKTQISTLEKDKQIMGDTVNNLRSSKQELAEKIALASILRAENIKIIPLDKKGKEQTKEGIKAKKVDKLKITFNLADNKVAKKDNKQIMLRVIDPSGAVLFDNTTGGGTFTAGGKEIPYTAMQDISFSNTKQKLTYNYVKGSPYVPGTYKIEIYTEGHMIGEASFVTKK